jgi:hypothetical protein
MAKTTLAERLAASAARRCDRCGKPFMTMAQLAHHKANAARLCPDKRTDALLDKLEATLRNP